MKVKKLAAMLIVPSAVMLTSLSLYAQVGGEAGGTQRPAGGGDAAVTGQKPPPAIGGDAAVSGQNQTGARTPQSSAGMAASNDEIRSLQQALKDRGQDPGTINGVMTPQTQQALRSFQAQ